jgi:hypothetical protein
MGEPGGRESGSARVNKMLAPSYFAKVAGPPWDGLAVASQPRLHRWVRRDGGDCRILRASQQSPP